MGSGLGLGLGSGLQRALLDHLGPLALLARLLAQPLLRERVAALLELGGRLGG